MHVLAVAAGPFGDLLVSFRSKILAVGFGGASSDVDFGGLVTAADVFAFFDFGVRIFDVLDLARSFCGRVLRDLRWHFVPRQDCAGEAQSEGDKCKGESHLDIGSR